jgi:hypothetical protein
VLPGHEAQAVAHHVHDAGLDLSLGKHVGYGPLESP